MKQDTTPLSSIPPPQPLRLAGATTTAAAGVGIQNRDLRSWACIAERVAVDAVAAGTAALLVAPGTYTRLRSLPEREAGVC